jgi:hypothetical protein
MTLNWPCKSRIHGTELGPARGKGQASGSFPPAPSCACPGRRHEEQASDALGSVPNPFAAGTQFFSQPSLDCFIYTTGWRERLGYRWFPGVRTCVRTRSSRGVGNTEERDSYSMTACHPNDDRCVSREFDSDAVQRAGESAGARAKFASKTAKRLPYRAIADSLNFGFI